MRATVARILTIASGHLSCPLTLIASSPPSGFVTALGMKLARPPAALGCGVEPGCGAGLSPPLPPPGFRLALRPLPKPKSSRAPGCRPAGEM